MILVAFLLHLPWRSSSEVLSSQTYEGFLPANIFPFQARKGDSMLGIHTYLGLANCEVRIYKSYGMNLLSTWDYAAA